MKLNKKESLRLSKLFRYVIEKDQQTKKKLKLDHAACHMVLNSPAYKELSIFNEKVGPGSCGNIKRLFACRIAGKMVHFKHYRYPYKINAYLSICAGGRAYPGSWAYEVCKMTNLSEYLARFPSFVASTTTPRRR